MLFKSPSLTISTSLYLASIFAAANASADTNLYSIGEPTAKEQLYVELINRARANPTAEGLFLNSLNDATLYPNIYSAYNLSPPYGFNVNLTAMKNEFVTGSTAGLPTLNVTPPLAINSKLTAAARLHAQDQIDNDFQGHTTGDDPSGDTVGDRLTAQGYIWSSTGENSYVASYNVLFGHAGFQVDWGGTDGTGMQGPPRPHRAGIHGSAFREIGLGNLTSSETTIPPGNATATGPEVCVQDFGTQSGSTPFLTGVAYYDLNANSFYDVGEGIGGINVSSTGTSKYCVTSTSGGYAIPMPGNGSYTVSFLPSNASSPTSYGVSITDTDNYKQDLILTYTPPSITGPINVALDDTNTYSVDPVLGAASYTWNSEFVNNSPTTEDADQGTSNYTFATSGLYSEVQSDVSVSGDAFRLYDDYNGGSGGNDQIFTLTRTFTPGPSGTLNFKSRFVYQGSGKYARVQISEDGGTTWANSDFNQIGPGWPGEASFNARSADLSSYSGQTIMIRFNLDFVGGTLFETNPSTDTSGWYIDDITFTDVEEITSITEATIASGNTFEFSPTTAGTYRVNARANLMGSSLAYGPSLDITVTNSDFTGWLTSNPSATGGNAGDPDLDGIINLLEYAFSLDPSAYDANDLPANSYTATHFTMSATRPSYSHGDITYAIQRSAYLQAGSWSTVKTFGPTEPLSYSEPLTTAALYFHRWKITLSP